MALEGSGRLAWSAIDKGIAAEWESAYNTLQALLATELPLTVHIEVLIGPGAAPGKWISPWRTEIKAEMLDAPVLIVDESHVCNNGHVNLSSEANVTGVTRAAQADPEPESAAAPAEAPGADSAPGKFEPVENPQTALLKQAELLSGLPDGLYDLAKAIVAGEREWHKLPKETRCEMVVQLGIVMARKMGRAPNMVEWDTRVPEWMPHASALPKTYAPSWSELRNEWRTGAGLTT